jgi:hypothetical protein
LIPLLRLRHAALLLLVISLVGCGGYRLQGIVLEGDEPSIEVVDQSDPRLDYLGLSSAEVRVILDPERLQPETVGHGTTDRDGRFAVPITASGAGFLMLDVAVRVERQEFRSAEQEMRLPGRGQRLVVVLPRGQDRRPLEDDNVLKETLEQADPYLRD